jgi:LysR family hydrogen peroxide-inducible transcriptional activator
LNLRDLRYLVAVAEHRHFGRAAEACFVSQPTLSTQLKKLEETLGVVLLERSNRRVMLTPEGEQIVQQTQRILVEVNSLTALSEQLRDPLGGDLRIGIIPTIAPYLLPKVLAPLRAAFPNLRIQLTEAQTANISRMLKQGDLDATLLALPLGEENITEFPLVRRAVCARSSPWPRQGRVESGDHQGPRGRRGTAAGRRPLFSRPSLGGLSGSPGY